MENDKPFKPVKDFANEKGLTVQAVYQAIKRGSLESKKIGTYTLMKYQDAMPIGIIVVLKYR